MPNGPDRSLAIFGSLLIIAVLCFLFASSPVQAQVGKSQKISNSEGGFEGTLDDGDDFGTSVAEIGDLDGDGTAEILVGAPFDDDGGFGETDRGAVWVLFLNDDGTVSSHQKISDTTGGFEDEIENESNFGDSAAGIGDLNGDGVPDVAVGADDNDGAGAVWILLLREDGTVSESQKIADGVGGFGGEIENDDRFGSSVTSIGDLDGDGVTDLAVGAVRDDDGGGDNTANHGAVWILFLNDDGTVADSQKISDTQGDFSADLEDNGEFGESAAGIGDLDADGVPDLAVGAPESNDAWILSLNSDGTVSESQKIGDGAGGFDGELEPDDRFGSSAARMGDLNGDGTPDVGVGAQADDDGGNAAGAVWILLLNEDETVASNRKISATRGGFDGSLDPPALFGSALTSAGDLDGDSRPDLAVGALFSNATWILFGGGAPLPVDLASFEARQTGQEAVELSWTTASETGNAGFEVQHQTAGTGSWSTVSFVKGSGSTTQAQQYRITIDENLAPGTHHFRLQQVDTDGSVHLSKSVAVELTMTEPVRLTAPAPNPVRQQATLSFAVKEPAQTTVTLYNALGQEAALLYRGTPQAGESKTVNLLATGLPSGVYFLHLQSGTRRTTRRVTVVR